MSQVIDYTKMRKGTRTRGSLKVDYCPKCGRKGEIGRDNKGNLHVAHKGHIAYGMFNIIDDSCVVKAADPNREPR